LIATCRVLRTQRQALGSICILTRCRYGGGSNGYSGGGYGGGGYGGGGFGGGDRMANLGASLKAQHWGILDMPFEIFA